MSSEFWGLLYDDILSCEGCVLTNILKLMTPFNYSFSHTIYSLIPCFIHWLHLHSIRNGAAISLCSPFLYAR